MDKERSWWAITAIIEYVYVLVLPHAWHAEGSYYQNIRENIDHRCGGNWSMALTVTRIGLIFKKLKIIPKTLSLVVDE